VKPRRRREIVEWVGGVFAGLDAFSPSQDPDGRAALFWLDAGGEVVGYTVDSQASILSAAAEGLRAAMASPLAGRPRRPDRVRVALPELAEALRRTVHDLEIVCEPTPELDVVFAALRADVIDDDAFGASYLSPDIGPADVEALFVAASRLHRAAPWEALPTDTHIVAVTVESHGLMDGVLTVTGQGDTPRGVIVFPSLADFDDFEEMAEQMRLGKMPTPPSHLVLSFQKRSVLRPSVRKEIEEHGWETAGPDALPRLFAIDAETGERPVVAADVALLEAIALALTGFIDDREALLQAWKEGPPLVRTQTVLTRAGEVVVTLRAPYALGSERFAPPFDVWGRLRELGSDADGIDAEEHGAVATELLRRFEASPESALVAGKHDCGLLMDYAINEFGITITTLRPAQLDELVFEVFPRKLSAPASEAPFIIAELRAFYAFLGREYRFEHADACLRVLGGDAVEKLRAGLSDKRRFGMAKSFVMEGLEAGYDVSSPEGLDAWFRVRATQPGSKPGSGLLELGGPSASKHAARAKKAARKASRKSRRKNR
jgi:hypothetical protein